MLRTLTLMAVVGCGLSACNLTGDPTNSGFATPSSSGAIAGKASGIGVRSGSDQSSVTGNVYGYEVGAVSEDGLQGFTGIASGASVSAAPATGSATMNGRFEVAIIQGVSTDGTRVSGSTGIDSGSLTLVADFDNGTLTGSATGADAGSLNPYLRNNQLEIDGRFDGSELSGTATYDGVSGPLRGLVGGNEAIGAFHGHNDTKVHAGGFIVN